MLINTSSDSRFFSRVLNLFFSISCNSNKTFKLRVWDIGMNKFQCFILKKLNIDVVKIPEFVPFWNVCYTWKPYIYKNTNEDIFFYIDAGCTINNEISIIFDFIENDGYFFVSQGRELYEIIPSDFKNIIKLNKSHDYSTVFAAGIIGINKKITLNNNIVDTIYELTQKGYCLGFSKNEIHRDTNNLNIIRDCRIFRHDQSIINAVFRSYLDEFVIHDANIYASTTLTSDCIIYNQRKYYYKYFFKKLSIIKIVLFIYCYILDSFMFIYQNIKKIIKKII